MQSQKILPGLSLVIDMKLSKQMSIDDFESKGFKSHWRWSGLYAKECVVCGYYHNSEETPDICPGCNAFMSMPLTKRGDA